MQINFRPWLAALCMLVAQSAFASTQRVTLQTASSESFTAYAAGPKESPQAVVLVHDRFGVTPFYTEAAEKLAKEGYRVVALDLYGGRSAATHDEAGVLLGSLDNDLAARKLDAAVKWLGDRPRRVAAMGFSMGAKHALAGRNYKGSRKVEEPEWSSAADCRIG